MPSLNWTAFDSLHGSKSQNFEHLCRALVRLHFGRYGQFAALKNQPGVEFHLKLSENCPTLGSPPRWYGWQCKSHELTSTGDLRAGSKKDIEDSLKKTEEYLPNVTDWVLWTPCTLSKKDQEWYNSLRTKLKLHLWAELEIDTYLSGPGLMLRSTYFGDLIATPEELERRHRESIQPIRERWLEPVHQTIDAERIIRRMLGEPGSWGHMIEVGERLMKAVDVISDSKTASLPELENTIKPFITVCSAFADTLLHFHRILADGDLDIIQQKLDERKTLIDAQVHVTLRRLRASNLPIALDATNALDDMRIAQELLGEVEELLGVGLVAILADAGGGKTQMAAQLTASQTSRPAGILLHGRDLHRGQTLDNLACHFSINGNPMTSMERLLAALDAAGKRARCRLPVIIDGLNEAENPRDWKGPLSILAETIKGYPNVLVVCTLRTGEHRREEQMRGAQPQINNRESFAVMALPDAVIRIESEGFGGDVDDAIKKYFNYFKINPVDAEIPVEFLRHPLSLRIYCEVTNPKRESEVVVNYFPASLSLLFEKYVANASERISQMTNLSHPYGADDVDLAIYKFGLELWNSKQREISEASYRAAVSDTSRQWDSSIVNLLAQEGIVFRNPGREPGEYVITPTYDGLGGYIIANSLLAKHASDRTFEWLNDPVVIASVRGDDSHELASDIFKSLVALAPVRVHGSQLWKEVSDPLRNAALMFTTEIEARYLDEETVTALSTLIRDNPKARPYLFSRLKGNRGAANHPLNAEFLNSALRAMTVSERDLSWTEWIRGTRRERFNELLSLEQRWKENLTTTRTPYDRLQAKWVMWFLTSTDRELRDLATRALYWYGRSDPVRLFEESLSSLDINDPYIPERMLAASYGAAMARHVDIEDRTFVSVILPEFARSLYSSMFAKGAPSGTTHSLMREYATRIIEIASLHNPELFSVEEIQRSKPPFTDGGCREWGESETSKEEHHGLDSPFHMDFENYTLGSLVPNRWNYDYENEAYRKVRAQVLWRVEQLGWSIELFKNVDNSIANERIYPRIGSDAKETERYGKKYSWIAFFEMSGFLHDQGTLKNWREHTSSVDIDPSFPERVTKSRLINVDFLGDPEMDMKEWIANGPLPEVAPYLRLGEVQQVEGPWIALDGFAVQEDEIRGRSSFCFIRSFLVANQDADSFLSHLCHQDLGGRWLPEKPAVIYSFAGEIPWCDTFPKNGLCEFSFVTREEKVKVQRSQKVLCLDSEILGLNRVDFILRCAPEDTTGETKGQRHISNENLGRIEMREMPVEVEEVKREYAKFSALISVCDFSWEVHQTAASDAVHATTLAKEISADLELIGQPQTFDLFTKGGAKATFNVSDQSNDFKNHQSMFFIKENLLRTYLKKNDLVLIWAVWGERGYSSAQISKTFHGPDRPEQTYAVFSFVKRYD
jgi:hypothetical protein